MTNQQQARGRGWREQAACRDSDPEIFFPTAESGPARDVQVAAAKAVCARCPVRAECLTEALARIPYGIAGGLTEHERRGLRRATTCGQPARTAPNEGGEHGGHRLPSGSPQHITSQASSYAPEGHRS